MEANKYKHLKFANVYAECGFFMKKTRFLLYGSVLSSDIPILDKIKGLWVLSLTFNLVVSKALWG